MTTECILCDHYFHQTIHNPTNICPRCTKELQEEIQG